jgi:hypothetical protein
MKTSHKSDELKKCKNKGEVHKSGTYDSESVYRGKTDNKMAKRKSTKGQTKI